MERALEAVKNMIGDDDPDNCITARETPHGFWWRYTHASDEPEITLVAAIKVAASVAADEGPETRQDLHRGNHPRPFAGCLRVRL